MHTKSKGFWHKPIHSHKVWFDGLYMAMPFYAKYIERYASKADRDSLYTDIIYQFVTAAQNAYDPNTSLFRHACDESRSMFWADPQTDLSDHVCDRAVGWYTMAIVEVLDYIPENHPERGKLIALLNYLLETLSKYADADTGMWYQVLDCPGRGGNYLDATASAMYIYAFTKGLRLKYIDEGHSSYILGLYDRFIDTFIWENTDGTISITSCCSMDSLREKQMRRGDYAYYLSEPVIDNDCKVVGPFILASLEYEAMYNIDYHFDGRYISDGKPAEMEIIEVPAFEGAEGGGKYTLGGHGGKEYLVTSLEDSDEPGTLRHAVEARGARVVIFAISGEIHLKKALEIENPYISILGQTAPGKGITIRDNTVFVKTDQVIIRYLRFRLGTKTKVEADALGACRCNQLIVDHCSISWAVDENASFYANTNATISWCIISESLNSSLHKKGIHGYGGIWGGRNVTFHHNLMVSNYSRNPRFDHKGIYSPEDLLFRRGTVEFVNNIVFNWGMKAAYGGEKGWFNMRGNLYKAGPATKNLDGDYTSKKSGKFYLENNVYDVSVVKKGNYLGKTPDYGKIVESERIYRSITMPEPFACRQPMPVESVAKAYKKVLREAGASFQRDAVDKRIIKEVKSGKLTYKGSVTGIPGIIDSEKDVM